MIRNATDLTATEKAAVETLLGRCVEDGEVESIGTFEHAIIAPQERLEIADELRKYFAEVDTTREPVAEREREDAITEAMRSVRPSFRPRQ